VTGKKAVLLSFPGTTSTPAMIGQSGGYMTKSLPTGPAISGNSLQQKAHPLTVTKRKAPGLFTILTTAIIQTRQAPSFFITKQWATLGAKAARHACLNYH